MPTRSLNVGEVEQLLLLRLEIGISMCHMEILEGMKQAHGGHRTQLGGWIAMIYLDANSWEWEALQYAPNPRDHTGGAHVNGRVCVAGGRNGGILPSSNVVITDCYDPILDIWTEDAPIPQGRPVTAS